MHSPDLKSFTRCVVALYDVEDGEDEFIAQDDRFIFPRPTPTSPRTPRTYGMTRGRLMDLFGVMLLALVAGFASATYPPSRYVGCFTDGHPRIMGEPMLTSAGMSTNLCAVFCDAGGYYLFGTQNGNECFCSEATSDVFMYGPGWSDDCTTPCTGVPAEVCGGVWAMSLYQFESAPAPAPGDDDH